VVSVSGKRLFCVTRAHSELLALPADRQHPRADPAFIVKDWGESDVLLQINSKPVQQGDSSRASYENTATGTDLIIWVTMKSSDTVTFSISPKSSIAD
jgi:hypothetical protein